MRSYAELLVIVITIFLLMMVVDTTTLRMEIQFGIQDTSLVRQNLILTLAITVLDIHVSILQRTELKRLCLLLFHLDIEARLTELLLRTRVELLSQSSFSH